jgi:sigma-B regulation protein RsbU (phosphoserine phosphatase)
LTLLESLAFEAVQSLESVRLMRQEQEKQKLEREFAMAQEVQMALLPTSFKPGSYFDVAGQSIPTRYVGGDFYDLITLDDRRAAFVLGDVSGKGISAALLASMAQGVLQAQLFSGLPLDEIVTSLNKVVVRNSAANRFITLFCSILDDQGNFTFVNAGHNPPVLVRADGSKELLSSDAIVVGAFDFAEYSSSQVKLNSGDVVAVFTDGVTEAVDASNEMFGDERVEELIKVNRHLGAEEIKDIVFKEVLAYTRGLPQGDDITMIVLKIK